MSKRKIKSRISGAIKVGSRLFGHAVRKPNKQGWSFVASANAFFGKLGDRNPPSKIQYEQDKLEGRGIATIIRKNLKDKKWELYKKKR